MWWANPPGEDSVLNYEEAKEANSTFHAATTLRTTNFAPKIHSRSKKAVKMNFVRVFQPTRVSQDTLQRCCLVWFFAYFFFSFPQPEELVFRWAQRSEPKDRIFQTGGGASSSEKSEDSWALPIWQIPSQTGSVGAWGLVTKRKVPRGIYKGQLALWKHLRGARVSTMLKANTCIALDSEQKTETRRELWNPHSGHLTAIKKKCVRHDGVCAFLYRNMVLL